MCNRFMTYLIAGLFLILVQLLRLSSSLSTRFTRGDSSSWPAVRPVAPLGKHHALSLRHPWLRGGPASPSKDWAFAPTTLRLLPRCGPAAIFCGGTRHNVARPWPAVRPVRRDI